MKFLRRNIQKEKPIEKDPTTITVIDGLIGFSELKAITPEFGYFHDTYAWGEDFVFGRKGACWRLYSKEGYPLTRDSHSITLGSFGMLTSKLGASEQEYDIRDLTEDYEGLKNLIRYMIEEKSKK